MSPAARALRAYRLRHELTLLQMADRIGVSAPTLHAYETGRATPRDEKRPRIERATAGEARAVGWIPDVARSRRMVARAPKGGSNA